MLIVVAQGWKFRSRWTASLMVFAAGLLLCHSIVRLYASAQVVAAGHKAWTSVEDNDGRELLKVASWIRANVPENQVVSANLDPLFYLYTGHQTVRGFAPDYYELFYKAEKAERRPAGTDADLRRELRTNHVDYLVITPDRDFLEIPFFRKSEEQLIQSFPSVFHRAYQGETTGYEIFAVDWEKL